MQTDLIQISSFQPIRICRPGLVNVCCDHISYHLAEGRAGIEQQFVLF